MYSTPLSPVMEEALMAHEENCINFLQTTNASTLSDFLSEKLIQALLQGQKSLIILPEGCDLNIPAKTLAQNKLAHLVMVWDADHKVDAKIREKLKILTRLAEVERNRHSFENLNTYINVLTKDIEKQIESYYLPLGHGNTIKSLANYFKEHESVELSYPVRKNLASIQDPYKVYEGLDQLENLYHQRFILMESSLINHTIYEDRERHIKSRNEIIALHNFIEELTNNFLYAKEELLRDIDNTIEKEGNEWYRALSEIKESYYTHDIEYSKVDFAAIVVKSISEARSAEYLTIDDSALQNLTWQNGKNVLQVIEELLYNQEEILISAKQKYWKRLTPFNVGSNRLKSVLTQVKELSDMLSTYEWLDISCNSQMLTLSGLEDQLIDTCTKIRTVKTILTDAEYNQFKQHQTALNINADLLNLIKHDENKSWKEVFNQIVISKILNEKSKRGQQTLQSRYLKLKDLQAQKSKIAQDIVHNIWCKKRNTALNEYKYKHVDSFGEVFYSSNESIRLNDLLHKAPEFLLTYYPVMIVRQNDLSHIFSLAQNWDQVIFYDSIEIDPNHIEPFVNSEKEITIVTSQPINLNPIQNKWTTHLFFSKDERIQYTQPFSLLQRSERYHQARALCIAIHKVIDRCNIYRLKNKCIISFVHEKLDENIIASLPSKDLNVLYKDSDQLDDLIEAMALPETDIFILCENGLLNDQKIASIEWQLHVLELIEQAQINLINIDTLQLMKNYQHTFRKIVESLGSSTMEETNIPEYA